MKYVVVGRQYSVSAGVYLMPTGDVFAFFTKENLMIVVTFFVFFQVSVNSDLNLSTGTTLLERGG